MNISRKIPLKSSDSQKNPYSTTGLSGNDVISPIEALLSRITVNFAKISQDKPNFAARVHSLTAQKTQKNQKTTANRNSCGFTLCN
jgi:hypothetical protein